MRFKCAGYGGQQETENTRESQTHKIHYKSTMEKY